MVMFLAYRIERAAKISLRDGKAMYLEYMINIQTYARWKNDVDAKLIADGYGNVIVEG